MATWEVMPQPENYPRFRNTLVPGMPAQMSPGNFQSPEGVAQANAEQAVKVKMILDALQGPQTGQDVPLSGNIGAPYPPSMYPERYVGPAEGGPGRPGNKLRRTAEEQQQAQNSPTRNKQALLDALRNQPERTMEAMRGLNEQMKGMPTDMRDTIMGGYGIGEEPEQKFDAGRVTAAASGMKVPGMTQAQAQAMQKNQREQANLGEVERARITRETAAMKPLTPQQMASLYKWNPKTERPEAYHGPTVSGGEAQKQGYRFVNPKQLAEAQGNADAINNQFILLNGAIQAASGKNYAELVMSQESGGSLGGIEGINLAAAIRDFAVFWEKSLGGVRMVASPTMLQAMEVRLPKFFDDDYVRKQKMKLLAPAVHAMQREKLTALLGLPPDPRIRQDMVAALRGMKSISPKGYGPGLTDAMIDQFVYQSGGVEGATEANAMEQLPVAATPENIIEFGGKKYLITGPGTFKLLPGQ